MRRAKPSVVRTKGLAAIDDFAERVGSPVFGDEGFGTPDHVEAALLAFIAGRAPRREAMTAEYAADRRRVRCVEFGDVQSELEAGPAPIDPQNLVSETSFRQLRAIDGRRKGDDRIRMKMVDVHLIDEGMHGGVDAGRGSASSEEAVVEEPHHLVFMSSPR